MVGFVNRFNKSPKSPGTQQPNNGSIANPQDNAWALSVKFARYTEKGNIAFKLSGFHWEDEERINQLGRGVYSLVVNKDKKSVYLVISPNKIDEFKQLLPTLQAELKKNGKYTDKSIADFGYNIEDALDKTPTPEEVEANQKVVISNWKDLLQALKDPETRKKFLKFQESYVCETTFGSARLSPRNVSEILMKDPQASFVTDEHTWLKNFGHRVKPGSPFIIITKGDSPTPSEKIMNTVPAVAAEGGWKQFKKNHWDDNNKRYDGAYWGAIKKAKKDNNLWADYYPTKVYDVRFTEPIDPNNDPFIQVADLVNNLTGELNNAAKEKVRKDAIAQGLESPDVEAKREGITTSEELEQYKEFILKKCRMNKITVVEVGSTEDIIADAIYAYAYNQAEKFNVLSPNAKAGFANAVLYSVASTINLQSSKVYNSVNAFDNLRDDERQDVIQKTYEVYRTLASVELREGVIKESFGHIMSFKEYVQNLEKIYPNKENIKRRFDAINERLNNVKF